MYSRFPPRRVFAGIFIYCVGLIGFGLILQHMKGIEPCPLCNLQRYGFICAGILSLLAALHGPNGFMRRAYSFLVLAATFAGGSISIRQIWLQHNPPQTTICGPDLQYMLQSLPLSDSLPMLFRGDGDCAKVDWSFLGLSIAEWALASFTLIALLSLWQMLRKNPERRRFG